MREKRGGDVFKETTRVINPWVAEILEQGGDSDTVVRHAQTLAREAWALSESLKGAIDREFGGSAFRLSLLEALLRKERELDALRQRTGGSGRMRAGDENLRGLLQRRMHEYVTLANEIRRHDLGSERRLRVEAYLDARRRQLYLGDAERVRQAIADFLTTAAIAS